MDAEKNITRMIDAIKSGKTIYISTYTKTTKIDRVTLVRWAKSGHTLLKAVGNSMYMAVGRKFVCIDYCKITITE